jgi:hypothetical protein
LPAPISRGSIHDAPPSGTNPMFTNAWRKYALSLATQKSAASARLQPIPAAGPRTALTTGTERSASVTIVGL